MNTFYYDAFVCILTKLDLQSLVNMLNSENKTIYDNTIKFIRQRHIYKDIIRYDSNRFALYGKSIYKYNNMFQLVSVGCNLSVLKFIKNNMFDICPANIIDAAVYNGNLENIKWLREQDCPFTNKTFELASANCKLDNMKWLKEQNCPWTKLTFEIAAYDDNIENMKWLKEQDCPIDDWTLSKAICSGNLENIKWVKDNVCGFHRTNALYSAHQGHLHVLKWLKENNYVFDKWTFLHAVYHCDPNDNQQRNILPIELLTKRTIEMLIWLKSIDCPYDKSVLESAIDIGNSVIIEWLKANGYS